MIIRWHKWSSDCHGDRKRAWAGATMSLTWLSILLYFGELTNACRSVHGAPSQRVMKSLRRILSPRFEGLRRNDCMPGYMI